MSLRLKSSMVVQTEAGYTTGSHIKKLSFSYKCSLPGGAVEAVDVAFAPFSNESRTAFARPIISLASASLTSMDGWPTPTGEPWTWIWWVRVVWALGAGDDPRLRARASEAANRSAPVGGWRCTRWTTFWSTLYSLSFLSSWKQVRSCTLCWSGLHLTVLE